MTAIRILLGLLGGALVLYGALWIIHGLPTSVLLVLGGWLVAVVIIHLGVLSPIVLAVGAMLHRVPDRGRAFLQGGLIAAGIVTVIALPLMLRQSSQPPAKAMLLQDYRLNLLILLMIIAVATSIAYAIRVARDRATAR